jgi:sugar phosphate isomerase/epimerase
MQLGIFTFYVPGTVDETAKRIRAYGFDTVQLNLEFKDWRFDDDSSPAACQAVRETLRGNGLSIAAIAGYLNPIARDPARRRANLDRMKAMLERAGDLGSPYVATETGSLHPHDDWAPHPDNETPAAFEQTCEDDGNLARADEVQRDMFARTAPHLKLAHAKDVRRIDGAPRERHHHMGDPTLYGGMEYPSAGLGDLNYELYLSLLQRHCPDVPLIVEHLEEADVPRAKAFVAGRLTVQRN